MATALYELDGSLYLPTELTRGPWSDDAQHGGPPAALLAREVARFDNADEKLVVRLTVELLRPVPLTPLRIEPSMVRPGRNVQIVGARMVAGETEVARATAVRLRQKQLDMPSSALERAVPPPGPDTGEQLLPPWEARAPRPAYHSDAVEHRFVAGGFDRPGPSTDWIRLRVPLVEGEATSPLSRTAAAADFGNGVSWVLSRLEGYTFINPDLTIYLHRPPAGEWVCLDALTIAESNGIGLAESRLWDEQGPIGRAVQSLLIDRE